MAAMQLPRARCGSRKKSMHYNLPPGVVIRLLVRPAVQYYMHVKVCLREENSPTSVGSQAKHVRAAARTGSGRPDATFLTGLGVAFASTLPVPPVFVLGQGLLRLRRRLHLQA